MKISSDLPDYMQLQYSVVQAPKKTGFFELKRRSQINSAVSRDSPDIFHLNHVRIIDHNSGNRSSVSVNKLKQREVFTYSDIKNQAFDYHSLGFSKGLDMKNEYSSGVRSSTPYVKEYSRVLSCGFGRQKGQFTLESQIKINRLQIQDLKPRKKDKMATSANKIHRNQSLNLKILDLRLLAKKNPVKSSKSLDKAKKATTEIEYLQGIEEFEKKHLRFIR